MDHCRHAAVRPKDPWPFGAVSPITCQSSAAHLSVTSPLGLRKISFPLEGLIPRDFIPAIAVIEAPS